MKWDDVREALREQGVHVEPQEASVPRQIIASSLGGIAGQVVANAGRLGPLGVAVSALVGSLAGHFAVTHRVHLTERPRRPRRPESPAAHSDRR